jgi:hypothetical protein
VAFVHGEPRIAVGYHRAGPLVAVSFFAVPFALGWLTRRRLRPRTKP